jgi:hypothetical protein
VTPPPFGLFFFCVCVCAVHLAIRIVFNFPFYKIPTSSSFIPFRRAWLRGNHSAAPRQPQSMAIFVICYFAISYFGILLFCYLAAQQHNCKTAK